MFWQLSLSTIFLGKRFAKVQLLGAATVVAGVCFAAWPQQGGSGLLQEVRWPTVRRARLCSASLRAVLNAALNAGWLVWLLLLLHYPACVAYAG